MVCYCVLNASSSSANCPAVIFSGSSCRVASGSWLNAPSVSGSSQHPSNVIRCSTSSDSVMCSPADNHKTRSTVLSTLFQLLNDMHSMVGVRFLPFSCSRASSLPRSTAHSFLPSSSSSFCCPRTRNALVSCAGDKPNAGRWLTYTTLEEQAMDHHGLHFGKLFPYV